MLIDFLAREASLRASLSLNDAKKKASDAAERRYLEECLEKANGKVTDLARNIGMNRSQVQTRLKNHGLTRKLHDIGESPEL